MDILPRRPEGWARVVEEVFPSAPFTGKIGRQEGKRSRVVLLRSGESPSTFFGAVGIWACEEVAHPMRIPTQVPHDAAG